MYLGTKYLRGKRVGISYRRPRETAIVIYVHFIYCTTGATDIILLLSRYYNLNTAVPTSKQHTWEECYNNNILIYNIILYCIVIEVCILLCHHRRHCGTFAQTVADECQ